MPMFVAIPQQAVPVLGGFDYVTVDAARRRIYAAHTGSQALLVVDADSGHIIGQVRVGPMHGVAVDPATGHVFTGNGTNRTVSEVDPVALSVLRTASVDGPVDALAYDPGNGHIYADEAQGTRVFVLDARTMASIGTVALPGHDPEYLAVDPATHEIYQNISDLHEFVVIDGTTLAVTKTLETPEIEANSALQYDAAYGHVLVAGANATIAAYDRAGKLVGTTVIQNRVDQCSLDAATHEIACAGSGQVTVLRDNANGAPSVVAQAQVAPGAHTVGIDGKTGLVWVVWAQGPDGDFITALRPGM
jgi:DNA-binding beta-propeller fold protein YncE